MERTDREYIRAENTRVLIVDDQDEIHEDFSEMLQAGRGKGAADELAASFVEEEERPFLPEFELLHASSGEEACRMVEAAMNAGRPIAAAYVDIRMPPGIDGIETVRRIRKVDRDVEIVIMTAYTDKSLPDIIEDMELLHKVLYIRKPFAPEEIQQITLSLVGKWNIGQELAEKQRELIIGNQQLEAVFNATGDAMAMYDADGNVTFANRAYEKLVDLEAGELKQISSDALEARMRERFEEPTLPDVESRFLLEDHGEVVSEKGVDQAPRNRLFYRSSAPVRDRGESVIGRLIVYRDLSTEMEIEQMKAEVLRLRTELEKTFSFSGLVGGSPPMQKVYALIKQAAESEIAVLIRGESGTGKELVARSFHYSSRRKERPFVAVNCAAVPEGLIESELFGHERGAFTGATDRRIGAFESASGGTIFLDEIGDTSAALQARLLRVLQEKEVQRLGSTVPRPIDVRVIAATNQKLEDAMRTGAFREDLFHRLSAFPIVIPPLRERREDIPLLANHFLERFAARQDKSISGLSTAAMRTLIQYDWPGNVRELENAIERAVLLETNDVLQAGNLPPQLWTPGNPTGEPAAPTPSMTLAELERQAIIRALEIKGGNVAEAARALGINKATLYRRLKKYERSAKG